MCWEKASFDVILLSFVLFGNEVPDNGLKAKTGSMIL
jgi:hypothetical protein